jgi:hypothetical protein
MEPGWAADKRLSPGIASRLESLPWFHGQDNERSPASDLIVAWLSCDLGRPGLDRTRPEAVWAG